MVTQGKTLTKSLDRTRYFALCFPFLILLLGLIIILLKVSAQEYWSRDSYKYLEFIQKNQSEINERDRIDDYVFKDFDSLPPALLIILKGARVCGLSPAWTVVVLNIILWFLTGLLLYNLSWAFFSSSYAANMAVFLYVSLPSMYLIVTEVQRDIGYVFTFTLLLSILYIITRKNGNWIWWFCGGATTAIGVGWRREGLELLVIAAFWFVTEILIKKWHPDLRAICRSILSFSIGFLSIFVVWGILAGGFWNVFQVDLLTRFWDRICYLFSN